MYAIIENGNKQYRVSEGEVVRLEKLNANVGDSVEFNVVMVSDENGVKGGRCERKGQRYRAGAGQVQKDHRFQV